MTRRAMWALLMVAFVSAGVVANGIYHGLTANPATAEPIAEVASLPTSIPVVVAHAALKPGTRLAVTDLEVVTQSATDVTPGIFTDTESLIGRTVKTEIPVGTPVRETYLAPMHEADHSGMKATVPDGYRAVGVFVDTRGGVQQFLRIGDRVDVAVTYEETGVTSTVNPNGSSRRITSRVVLQDIEVLDVPDEKSEDQEADNRQQRRVAKTFQADISENRLPVVLALTPSQGEKLSLAMQIGTIHLLKRGADDTHQVLTPGVTQDTLFADKAQQVMIEVRIAEVNRTLSRDLGVDYIVQDKDYTQSQFLSGALVPQLPDTKNANRLNTSSVEDTVLSSTVNQFFEYRRNGPDIGLALKALQEKGLVRILAEPNLLAVSGQEASFLAGGEFPIPVVQATSGTSVNSSVTIEFKEFGVRLGFRPDVVNDDEIRLFVAPEVSVLQFGSASVQISGFTIPSLLTRKSSTTVQMHSGESLVIGGLLNEFDTKTNKQIPFLGSIPVLGKLFSSEQFQNEETELMVIVTPRLVKPQVIDVHQPFSDPKAVKAALDKQARAPLFPDERGEAIREAIMRAVDETSAGTGSSAVTPVEMVPVTSEEKRGAEIQ